jgi:AraC-like DNA-binding protein
MKLIRSANQWLVVHGSRKIPLEQLAFENGYRFDTVCDAVSCNPRRLHEIFVRDLGLTPKDWLKSERMAAACRMLEGGCWPAKAARLLGFATQSNFGREFTATYGIPPGKYREQALARQFPPSSCS